MFFVMKVNISARRYHRQLNLSLEADFENVAQEDPQLIAYIREHHLRPPYKGRVHKGSHSAQPITELGEMFGWKVSFVFTLVLTMNHTLLCILCIIFILT